MIVEDEQEEEEAPKKRKSANGAGKVSYHFHPGFAFHKENGGAWSLGA